MNSVLVQQMRKSDQGDSWSVLILIAGVANVLMNITQTICGIDLLSPPSCILYDEGGRLVRSWALS